MSVTIDIRDQITKLLQENGVDNIYYIDAPGSAEYPYAVFETRQTVVSDGMKSYNVEFNVWDKYKTHSRVETIADKIERILDHENLVCDSFIGVVYQGYKQHVDDPDKQIKRIQVTMNMVITERK